MSNSTNAGMGLLEHVKPALSEFLSGQDELVFLPFALADHDTYFENISGALGDVCEVKPAHRMSGRQIQDARAYFVGGGNTFRLLRHLQEEGLIEPLRHNIAAGARYIGSSAGTAIAGPSIRTTNDMPIVQTRSLESLGLVEFHLNCHYVDPSPLPRTFMGETRDERLAEFLEENESDVVALREGAWILAEKGVLTLCGDSGGRLFRRGRAPKELRPNDNLSLASPSPR